MSYQDERTEHLAARVNFHHHKLKVNTHQLNV